MGLVAASASEFGHVQDDAVNRSTTVASDHRKSYIDIMMAIIFVTVTVPTTNIVTIPRPRP